jgi:serine/threonine protein kinase
MKSAAVVAVKIIDMDESDTLNPAQANSIKDFMQEVGALRLLGDEKATNINHVIDTIPVGKSMWMITEFCGGGSVATLVR